jgi:hypothetical protein
MLKLNRLLLEVSTADGRYGADIPFANGLNVIRADNSAGKSTCLQGAMYALGLEPMLGPRHEIPLPHAMTDWLDGSGGQRLNVLESKVVLEATNGEGREFTFERFAKREGLDHRLVFVREGHALSDPAGASVASEFFARGPGSATHERGLGSFVTEFIGWHLPTFVGPDDTETRLYLESVFPLLFVEQKRGWGGIHRFVPPYAQVAGVRQRAFEFLLRLDVLDAMQQRMELQRRQQILRRGWQEVVAELKTMLRSSGVLADAVPEEPLAAWPPTVEPRLVVASGAGEWQSVFDVRQALRARLHELERPLPTAGEAAPEVEAELRQLEERLNETSRLVEELEAQIELEREQSQTMMRRVKSIKADELRYRDAITIQRYGGSILVEQINGDCPTCGQHLPEVLNAAQLPQPMPLDENLDYLREQRSVFEGLLSESNRLIEARLSEREALYDDLRRVQRQIRSSRSTLVAPQDAPAEAILRERIDIAARLEALDGAEHAYEVASARLEEIAGDWAVNVAALRALPADGLSLPDREKLAAVRESLVEQLDAYRFSSVDLADLEISLETYQPSLEGIDLGFDVSASDWIRIIWAYLLGLMEISRRYETNHPKILIFDEPGQQSTDPVSLDQLLKRAERSREFGEQVILATSEPTELLEPMLADLDLHYIRVEGKLLKRF